MSKEMPRNVEEWKMPPRKCKIPFIKPSALHIYDIFEEYEPVYFADLVEDLEWKHKGASAEKIKKAFLDVIGEKINQIYYELCHDIKDSILYRAVRYKKGYDFVGDIRRHGKTKEFFPKGRPSLEPIGIHWTWDKEYAAPYDESPSAEGKVYILKARVDLSDIDMDSTIIKNIIYEEEHEVTMKSGAKVMIIEACDERDNCIAVNDRAYL